MRCKDIKKCLIDRWPQQMSELDSQMLAEHVSQCPSCFKFQQELQLMRQSLETLERPLLPLSLDQKTKKRCCELLACAGLEKKLSPVPFGWLKVPKIIWGAFLFITVFTLVLIAPFFEELSTNGSLSTRTIYTIIIILQNAVMLILAPLLLQRYGKKTAKPFRTPVIIRGYGRLGGV